VKSNNTHFNILVSYAYTGKAPKFNNAVINESVKGNANVMIDSGAFTIYNAKKVSKLNLDSYCSYLETNAHKVEKYVMLDVIKNEKKTRQNYLTMLDRGFNPMYVFTEYDTDWEFLNKAVQNQKHLCVAGGVTNRGDWMLKRYQDVYKNSKADIHALGFVQYNDIFRLPLHSVDSSSWLQSSEVYGILNWFEDKIKSVRYIDVLTRKKKMPIGLKQALEELKVTPKDFSNLDNHKGARSIGTMLNAVAYTKYQQYAKRLGLNLFLAIANTHQLNVLLYINDNLDNLNYNQWKQKH
jgi:hypothetical protein